MKTHLSTKRAIAIALSVAATAAGAVASTQLGTAQASGPKKLSADQVKQIALAWASHAGETAPSSIQHVETTRVLAVFAYTGGALIPSTEDVYLVSEQGHFRDGDAPVPQGAHLPRGQVLNLVIDAVTGRTTDFGLSGRQPNMSRLGLVTDDLGSPSSSIPVTQQLVSPSVLQIPEAQRRFSALDPRTRAALLRLAQTG
jgi:hypothetical protein